jgi:hypothetical protein
MIDVILDNRWKQLPNGQFVFQKYVGQINPVLDKDGYTPISIRNGRWEDVRDIERNCIAFDNPISRDRIDFHRSE